MSATTALSRLDANVIYEQVLVDHDVEAMRNLARTDLFFLLTVVCKRYDADRDYVYERCREFEADPDGRLDLWAREHYKSTIITFAGTIQEILKSPEVTVGIFSHTRPIAVSFLKQIKQELEDNDFLKTIFPEIFYKIPNRESPSWSIDRGITVKRQGNPKEATVEAYGLVDGQPTSKHFGLLVYDDVVTLESVGTPEQIKKTTEAWALSLNLGSAGGRKRIVGTYYHFNDTYHEILKRGAAIPRIHPATKNGKVGGEPMFFDRQILDEKRAAMGPYVYSCQMLLDPVADDVQGFKTDWLRYYDKDPPRLMNKYLIVDPAGAKKKENDYTVMALLGLAEDKNYYLLDGIRDRLNLTERARMVFRFVRKWYPDRIGYEKYGMQADVEHINDAMDRERFRFNIIELGGPIPKNDRIRKLIPIFENGRFWMPRRLLFVDNEGKTRDFIREFLDDEYTAFPVSVHDDVFDCFARVVDPDLGAGFPTAQDTIPLPTMVPGEYKPFG
jgi:phage terminase large subunit-like protein